MRRKYKSYNYKRYYKKQSQQLEETQQTLTYSQTERQETSQVFAEISQKLSNSVPLTPGPNVNKPRLSRPQDLAYQAALKSQEKEADDKKDPSSENNILKTFSHLTKVLKKTNKTDVNMPPKFNGDDNHFWEAWSKQW
jgi:hypothetical protein